MLNRNTSSLHIEMIRAELHRRRELNPRSSLRGFAAFLELHPSALSRILSGKQTLAVEAAKFVLSKINFTEVERSNFAQSVAREKYNYVIERLTKDNSDESAETHVSDELFRDLVTFLSGPCWIMNSEGEILESNDALSRLAGPVSHLESLLGMEQRDLYFQNWNPARAHGRAFQHSCALRSLTGEVENHQIRAIPLQRQISNPNAWLCVSLPEGSPLGEKSSSEPT